jgi:exodeoxyribonuclease III
MKIASFNINNIRKRLPNLLDWLREAGPDVVCLQELKAMDAEFPAEAIRQAGYEPVWRGQKSWNGVAILARWAPVLTCGALPGDPNDTQSRYIEAAVNGVVIASIYAPNGNPQPWRQMGGKDHQCFCSILLIAIHCGGIERIGKLSW